MMNLAPSSRRDAESSVSGVDPELERLATGSLEELLRHIDVTHHVHERAELERLAPVVARSGTPRLVRLVEAITADLLVHLSKEENILFPYILEMEREQSIPPSPFGSIAHPIRVMDRDHRALTELVVELHAVLDAGDAGTSELKDQLLRLEADLERHMLLEDGVLFPRSIALEAELQGR